jgi:hypothetical protein
MLAENRNVSEGTLSDIMGHGPGSHMARDLYSHVRMQPKRDALDSLVGLIPGSVPVRLPTTGAPVQGDESLSILYSAMPEKRVTRSQSNNETEDALMTILREANGI